MADTTFVDNDQSAANRVVAAWLNDVDNLTYQGKTPVFVTSTGSANAYVVTLPSSLLTTLATGQQITFLANFANSGAATLEVVGASSTGAIAIQFNQAALVANVIASGSIVTVRYANSVWNLLTSALTGTQTFADPITFASTVTFEGAATFEALVTFEGAVVFESSLTFAAGSEVFLSATAAASLNMGAPLANGDITASAGSNAITIAVKAVGANDPSSSDPVTLNLRNATITSGTHAGYAITGALSTVISSGSTLGCASSEKVRIHVGAMLNASTGIELFYYTAAVAASKGIKGIDPTAYVTTSAEGGAGAADSAQTAYSTTARTSQPWQYLGYIEATSGATAGQWASVDKVVNWRLGMPMPGDEVNNNRFDTGAVATGTTVIPGDNTIPQNTEGDQYLTVSITQLSNLNFHETEVQLLANGSVNNASVAGALFKNSVADAVKTTNAATRETNPTTDPLTCSYFAQAGTTSPTVYNFRAGLGTAGTTTVNGSGGAGAFGSTYDSHITVKEYHI